MGRTGILKTSPEALKAFIAAYEKGALDAQGSLSQPFGINSKQAVKKYKEMARGAGGAREAQIGKAWLP